MIDGISLISPCFNAELLFLVLRDKISWITFLASCGPSLSHSFECCYKNLCKIWARILWQCLVYIMEACLMLVQNMMKISFFVSKIILSVTINVEQKYGFTSSFIQQFCLTSFQNNPLWTLLLLRSYLNRCVLCSHKGTRICTSVVRYPSPASDHTRERNATAGLGWLARFED